MKKAQEQSGPEAGPARILIAEDDESTVSAVKKGLEAEGHHVEVVADGEAARRMAEQFDYDLFILDLNLPRVDGLKVLRQVRRAKASLPVLVLSTRRSVDDRVKGLSLGADDYLPKPFSLIELSARVHALLRRGTRPLVSVLRVADLELDRVERQVRRANKRIDLTVKEFGLLEYLMLNVGRTVTREMIVEHVWNLDFDTGTNAVNVYINYLREKVDEGFSPRLIQTVRGVGYCMCVEKAQSA